MNETFEEKCQYVDGLCEATDYERLCLYREVTEKYGLDSWFEDSYGYSQIIDNDKYLKPINIKYCIVDIHTNFGPTYRICFWNAISQLVDYELVDKQNKELFPNVKTSDAMNFWNLIRS